MQCHYKLGDETLYSVKWYKDGNEFYRYVPRNSPATQVFPLVGVTVDSHSVLNDVKVVVIAHFAYEK
ncbi:hypothetical protein YQE_02859, partial [Dendroctonus ponderosae]